MTQRHVARAHIRTRTHTHTHTRMHTVKTTQECPPRQTVQRYSASHITLVDTWDNCPWGALVVQKKTKKKGEGESRCCSTHHVKKKKKKERVSHSYARAVSQLPTAPVWCARKELRFFFKHAHDMLSIVSRLPPAFLLRTKSQLRIRSGGGAKTISENTK